MYGYGSINFFLDFLI